MKTRRAFIKTSGYLAAGAVLLPTLAKAAKVSNVGIQLYTVRKEMLADATGTLKQLAKIGYKQLESARSDKGNFYGLQPKEIKKIAGDLGMTVRSGHVHIDKDWQKSIDMAAEAGQSYLVCSSLPSEGQTIANYQRCADTFSKAAEACKKANLVFGYHNHEYEFEKVDGKVLYDILLERTDPNLVKMEMDLGWVIVTGNDPLTYFKKFPGRFPLWHLKDMDKVKKESTEFGKGQINIKSMLQNIDKSGMKFFFVEQEEYPKTAMESAKYDYDYLAKLTY
ncbi:sugar phosphate isomerase/epimerase family protein [Spirosoma agri]|jgi:sugar phosphate isomerase/epimerase|uniref:Sugar phosphate isomerase/epimerase n=1 Tax=Spirosoma agri TaxID=1987381 RepID=A0A6M0ID60_9BACT|nr:sugar phosphate isomerase/epimerase [Spirosoma agri]NEU66144.1 sugar phosphate isomerase/epimerase [Spirosoma agri]